MMFVFLGKQIVHKSIINSVLLAENLWINAVKTTNYGQRNLDYYPVGIHLCATSSRGRNDSPTPWQIILDLVRRVFPHRSAVWLDPHVDGHTRRHYAVIQV